MNDNYGLLSKSDIPVGIPLEFAVVSTDGARLLDLGVTVESPQVHRFLFHHFTPCRAGVSDSSNASSVFRAIPDQSNLQDSAAVGLDIGAPIGVRSLIGIATPRYASKVIGSAPDGSLFVTHPHIEGKFFEPYLGEMVEVVAVGRRAIYLSTSSVAVIGRVPLPYLVLVPMGPSRKIRERNSMRMKVRLPLWFDKNEDEILLSCIGITKSLSLTGLSFLTANSIGEVGSKLVVSFELPTSTMPRRIRLASTIRNAHPSGKDEEVRVGVEFDDLNVDDLIAIKIFYYDYFGDPLRRG